MGRVARIIGTAADIWDDVWDVREARPTSHGFDLLFGWPAGTPRGKGGAGGPRIIVTQDLAAHLESIRQSPGKHGLPAGSTTVKRLRRLLGHHGQIDRAAWWEDRADDLADLTIEQFATRHGVSIGAAVNARHALFGPTLRPAGWWRAADVVSALSGPTADVADALGISCGSVRRIRAVLRGHSSPPSATATATPPPPRP